MMTSYKLKKTNSKTMPIKGWEAAAAAVVGRGHVKAKLPCQDATYSYSEGGAWTIALADGAGSAAKSELGATLLTRYIAVYFCQNFDALISCEDGAALKQQLLQGCREQLERLAESAQCKVKDLAATLLVVAVKNDRFLLMHIGDGVIGLLKAGELKVVSAPENGEYANSTYFVTSDRALSTMKLAQGSLQEVEGFVLMSDGSQACLYNKREKRLAMAIRKLLEAFPQLTPDAAEEQLKGILESVIRERTTDDCSLALLYRTEKLVAKVVHPHPRPCMCKRAKRLLKSL